MKFNLTFFICLNFEYHRCIMFLQGFGSRIFRFLLHPFTGAIFVKKKVFYSTIFYNLYHIHSVAFSFVPVLLRFYHLSRVEG